MPPHPSHDDDLIELTDIVEQGTISITDDDIDLLSQPGDDGFEKELEDLFDDQPDSGGDALLLEDEAGTAAGDDSADSVFSEFISPSRSSANDRLNASLNKSFGILDENDDFDLLDDKEEKPTAGASVEAEDYLELTDFDNLDKELGLLDEPQPAESGEDQDAGLDLLDLDELEEIGKEPEADDLLGSAAPLADLDAPGMTLGAGEDHGLDDLDDLDSLLGEVEEEASLAPEPPAKPARSEAPAKAAKPAEVKEQAPFLKALNKLSAKIPTGKKLAEEEEDLTIEEPAEPTFGTEPTFGAKPEIGAKPRPMDDIRFTEIGPGGEEVDHPFADLDQLIDELDISISETAAPDARGAKGAPRGQEDLSSLLSGLDIGGQDEKDSAAEALGLFDDEARNRESDDEEITELLEPWNEVSDEELLKDLAREKPSAAPAEENFPDLDELIASLDQDQETEEPALEAAAEEAQSLPLEDIARRVEALETRDTAAVDEILLRLEGIERRMAEKEAESIAPQINAAVNEALASDALAERLARVVVELMAPRMAELVDQRLKEALPAGELLTRDQFQELSADLKAGLDKKMENLAAHAAAEVIREELSALLTEEDGEE